MKKIITAFARNTVFANIVLLLLFLSGGLAVTLMIRETIPDMSLDMITITIPYLGADPEEVEEGISLKIEEVLEGVEELKQFNTSSGENYGSAWLEIKDGYDVNAVLDKVRSKVEAISTFPVDAEKPIIQELLIRNAVVLVSLSGEMTERGLKEWAENIKDEIQQISYISQVEIFGARDYEISIEVSEKQLRKYGLTFDIVTNAIRTSSMNMAGGTIRTQGEEIRVRTIGRKYTGAEFASIVVMALPSGEVITLDRVAKINDGFTEDPIQATLNGKPALLLVIYKTREEDAITISESMQEFVEKKKQQVPQGAKIDIFYDDTNILRDRINLLVKNGLIGLCLVFIILWVFLDTRLSFWGGMGIPISFAGAFAILWAMGATINMISLFGLIMVLGIVVDDAIVVGESIFVHRKRGEPPLKAAVEGVSEVGMPVFAAVLTTIVAFIPLRHVSGIMGKFIAIMPVVVISCLAISLVECLFLLPAHLSHLPDLNAKKTGKNPLLRRIDDFHRMVGNGLEWFVAKIYTPFLKKALHWRYISLCVAVSLLLVTMGLVKGGIIKFETFPDLDGFLLVSTLEFPEGTPPERTKEAVAQVDAALIRLEERINTLSGAPLIKSRYTIVGQTLEEITRWGPNMGAVQAILLDPEERGIHTKDLMVEWEKEVGAIPGIKSLTFSGMSVGPPGDPIEVWFQGQDMDVILSAADDLIERLHKFDGVYQIRSDFSKGKNEMRFTLKPEARTLGLTVHDLARQLNTGYFGDEVLRLQRGREDIRVKVRYTAQERSRISDLEKVRIRTRSGHEVPLLSVADVTFSPGFSEITRTDGMRRVAVSAALDTKKANASEIFAELSGSFFPQLNKKYPGLFVSLQGEQKKMRESFGSLLIGFPLAILAIFIIIATTFRSYTQPFVIMFTVPFGIIGGIFGHLLLGYNLSMLSIFGMVALSGVVVNDAIVLIERINENIAEGMPFFDAIIKGGARRFRAIFLTTISTVGGLTPLIMETDMQAKFLIPMAVSIAAGVTFATILTLVLIPSLLAILSDLRLLSHRRRHGIWPTREEVEPARDRKRDPLAEKPQTGSDPLVV
ncbi:MAG: efflux RND transporter permease subunit [Desulfobacterales bacterium]|nr:efflux RND transporter permease subunit [Desulfobacterales bacterium]